MPSGQVHLHMHRRDQAGAQAGQHRRQSQCSVQAHLRKMSQILSGSQNWKFIDKQPYCILLVCMWFTNAVHRFLCRIQPIPGCYRSFITFQDAPTVWGCLIVFPGYAQKKWCILLDLTCTFLRNTLHTAWLPAGSPHWEPWPNSLWIKALCLFITWAHI